MTRITSAYITGKKTIHSNKRDKDYDIYYFLYTDIEAIGRCTGQFVSDKGKYDVESFIKICINRGSIEPVEIDLDSDDLSITDEKGGNENG